jgi:tripartite-type tricarboxylate transporter receptor subunit TctC
VLALATVPPAILDGLHVALTEALAPQEIRARILAAPGIEVTASSRADFATFLNAEFDTWTRVIRERNIRAD